MFPCLSETERRENVHYLLLGARRRCYAVIATARVGMREDAREYEKLSNDVHFAHKPHFVWVGFFSVCLKDVINDDDDDVDERNAKQHGTTKKT